MLSCEKTKPSVAAKQQRPIPIHAGQWIYPLAIVVAIAVSCLLGYQRGDSAAMRRLGAILIVAPLLWLNPPTASVATLQRVIGLYLCCAPLWAAAGRFAQLSVFGRELAVSYGVGLLGVICIGYVLSRLFGARKACFHGLRIWLVVAGVIAAHMVFLWIMFEFVYGYGWERNFAVVGRICWLCMLCLLLWPPLASNLWRRIICLELAAAYAWLAIAGG